MKITTTQLANIVSTLITNPDKLGELSEASVHQEFVKEIALLVCGYCGGELASIDKNGPDMVMEFEPNDCSPEDGGIWSDEVLAERA